MSVNWINPFWKIGLFAIYVMMSCYGLYLIKIAEGWKAPTFAIGFFLYAAGAAIWMIILRLMPLSFAFPIAAGALVVGTLLVGVYFLGENVSIWHMTGSLLIVIGISLIAVNR